jgi:cyclopropane-fatty-acyl-phospholipid synthase
MTYSSALRCSSNDTLETAQLNKYGRIIDTLSLEGKNVLEIGCGWGGFAEQAANAGANVTGITISNEQFHFAKNRIGSKANILMQDYRDIKKKYDHIVSIEMFEAVGERYWSTYFSKIKESLTKGGRAIIQTITIRDDVFNAYRKNSDYIRHYVFPGGMLPSKNRFYNEVNNAKMDVASVLEFGQDYAWTLKQWLNAFVDVRNNLTNLNYSPYFLRAWEFYLSMCIAGFETKRTDVVQFEIVK